MENKYIQDIRMFVESECKKPTCHYGLDGWDHLNHVYNYASSLANKYSADLEIVLLAALLHDIGSIMCGRENHHITGAEIAEKKLKELGYAENKIQLIKNCILNHRGSVGGVKSSVEEQIIADADAMACFDNIDGLFIAALVYEKKNRIDSRSSILNKLKNSWNKLSFEESKKIIKPKFEAAMLLLCEKDKNAN